jgi:putative NADH-flavin reductase
MKILILGSTGRLGQCVLAEALNRGHEVHILVRNESHLIKNERITTFIGVSTDADILKKAMHGCDSLMNVLNISRTSDFPWSPLRTPKDFLSQTAKNIIEIIPQTTVKHVVICTAHGTNETKKDIPTWFRWIIENSNVKFPYLDHERQENLFEKSKIRWSIVRPVGLTNSKQTKPVRVSYQNHPQPSLMIGRQDVAKFMLDELEAPQYFGKMVTLSS